MSVWPSCRRGPGSSAGDCGTCRLHFTVAQREFPEHLLRACSVLGPREMAFRQRGLLLAAHWSLGEMDGPICSVSVVTSGG